MLYPDLREELGTNRITPCATPQLPHRSHGLSTAEATERLRVHGANELPQEKPHNVLAIVLGVFKEPMFLLLAGCSTLYLILGDFDEAVMLMLFVLVIIAITVYQERRAEAALTSLKNLSPVQATVIRDDRELSIEAKLLVPGDMVSIQEGDAVPADLVLCWVNGLMIDESCLSGESCPAGKSACSTVEEAERQLTLSQQNEFPVWRVWSGTNVVSGKGIGFVKATGKHTLLGSIAESLTVIQDEKSPLEKEVSSLVKNMAVLGACACAVVFVVYGLTHGDWMRATLSGLSLAMGLLPEEFPVVLNMFVTIGALRMSWHNVLVRKNKAVETLSSCTVVCTDKTGTLTTSGMSVHTIVDRDGHEFTLAADITTALPDGLHETIEYAALAGLEHRRDPMLQSVFELLKSGAVDSQHTHDNWTLAREYTFSRESRIATCVWATPINNRVYEVATKGAPEIVIDSCRHLTATAATKLKETAANLQQSGLRVLAIARGSHPRFTSLPDTQDQFERSFVGLVAFLNPLRPSATQVVSTLHTAGIRVIMLTGDSAGTAHCIAQSAGITRQFGGDEGSRVTTGQQVAAMSFDTLKHCVATCNVFARVLPAQKHIIVEALKANGEIVCTLGDGVNDAPALKASHVGVAMGKRGTQVARDAASMVLLDDELSSLSEGIKLGRRIRDNMRKAMAYIIAVHIPLCMVVLAPVLLGWPTIFWPAHIVCMELIIDPTCSIVLEAEPEEHDIMTRKPAGVLDRIVTKRVLVLSCLQGIVVTLFSLFMFYFAQLSTTHETEASTMTFITLIVANIALVMTNRSWTETFTQSIRRRNVPLWVLVIVVFQALLFVNHHPHLLKVLRFGHIHHHHMFFCALVGFSSVAWFEIYKYLKQRTMTSRHAGFVTSPDLERGESSNNSRW